MKTMPQFNLLVIGFPIKIGVAFVVLMAVPAPFDPGPMPLTARPNPLAGPAWVGSFYDYGLFVLVPGLVGGVWATISRFRSATREIRTQLRWFMAGAVAVVGLVLVVLSFPIRCRHRTKS